MLPSQHTSTCQLPHYYPRLLNHRQVHLNRYHPTHLGTFTVDTSIYYQNNAWNTQTFANFDVTLLTPRVSYTGRLTIQQLTFDVAAGGILNYTISTCAIYNTKILACMYSTSLNNLNVLRIRYIALDAAFSKFLIYTATITSNPGLAISNGAPYQKNFGLPALNTNTIHRNFLIYSGFNISSNVSTWDFDLKITATQLTTTSIRVTA